MKGSRVWHTYVIVFKMGSQYIPAEFTDVGHNETTINDFTSITRQESAEGKGITNLEPCSVHVMKCWDFVSLIILTKGSC